MRIMRDDGPGHADGAFLKRVQFAATGRVAQVTVWAERHGALPNRIPVLP
jgi:hypothetical protein